MIIAVIGTGYVGLSIATLLSQHHEVMAVDIIPKNIEKINEESSLLYSTDYIKSVEVEHAMPKMIDMLKPNLKNIISVINQYKLHAKFCVVVDLPEKPIIYFSSDVIKAMAQLSAEIEFDMYIG